MSAIPPRIDAAPDRILFLSGHTEGESELSFARSFAETIPWPEARVDVVTGNPDFAARWGTDATFVELPRGRVPVVHESRYLVMRALGEGLIDEADIVVSTSWYRALMTWVMGTDELVKYRGQRLRPTVYLCPQVNDQWEYETTGGMMLGQSRSPDYWWEIQSRWPTLHSVHPAPWDADEAIARSRAVVATPALERIHTWHRWEYGGVTHAFEDRTPGVVWAGRLAPLKDPAMGSEIAHLLAAVGRRFEAFALTAAVGTRRDKVDMPNLTIGLPQSEFHRRAGSAMVHLITSHREAGILVLWELAERGVIPVVRDKPWARRALPGWPLLFRNPGEAVAMCEEVLDHWPTWWGRLHALLEEHYPVGTANGAEVWEEVWRQWHAASRFLDVRSTSDRPRGMKDRLKELAVRTHG